MRKSPGRTDWLSPALPMAVAVIALGLAVGRSVEVQRVLGAATGCSDCFFWQALRSDLWLVGLVAACGAWVLAVRWSLLRVAMVLAMLVLLGLMAADLLVFRSLSLRLYFSDIAKFGAEIAAIHRFLVLYFNGWWPWILAATIGAGLGLVMLVARFVRQHRRGALGMGLLALVAVASAGSGQGGSSRYVHQESVRNWLVNNLDQGVDRPYSPEFIEAARRNATKEPESCGAGQASRPNVLLLVVESLSAYHSALMGGRGWTPRLDEIAAANTWFPDFHANGFTTDQGLIALLTGRVPLPSVGRYGSSQAYEGFEGAEGSVPTLLKPFGYSSHFFTTGNLKFLGKGEWCTKIGFDHVEGSEHGYYDKFPRFHFSAAPDSALFGRFLEWHAGRPSQNPFFATLLTVSSHPPFLDPETGTHQEEAVIRYVDRQIGDFYENLQKAGFFDNGILIIVGDHRAMTPVTAAETTSHGERALSRVPLILAGSRVTTRGRQDTLGQQADLPYSLAALVGERTCRPRSRGDFLANPPIAPAHIVHVRGDHRSWLSVYTTSSEATLNLAGDSTGWIGTPPANNMEILASVNLQRIQLGVAEQDAVNFMIELKEGKRTF